MFLITGPSAAGKSTVARQLASQFKRGVHLEADVFRRNIVSGGEEMTPEPSADALAQLRLRYRLAAVAADAYFEAGFVVVLEDVIAGRMLADCVELIRSRPLHVVVLMPRVNVLAARDAEREASGYSRWSMEGLYDLFLHETPRIGLWLDSSNQSVDQTVEQILLTTGTRL